MNRKLDYEIAAQDQTIYVTNTAELTELLSYAVGYEPDGTKKYGRNSGNNGCFRPYSRALPE